MAVLSKRTGGPEADTTLFDGWNFTLTSPQDVQQCLHIQRAWTGTSRKCTGELDGRYASLIDSHPRPVSSRI